MRFKGKRDKWVICTSAVERLDFKKLDRVASFKIDSEEENVRRRKSVRGEPNTSESRLRGRTRFSPFAPRNQTGT